MLTEFVGTPPLMDRDSKQLAAVLLGLHPAFYSELSKYVDTFAPHVW